MLAELGYDLEFSASPLKRIIKQKLEDELPDAMLSIDFENGDTIIIDIEETE